RPLVSVQTDHEKSRRHILLVQDIEDFWGPGWIRSVVEGDGEFLFGRANLVDVVGKRIGVVLFAGNEVGGGVITKGAVAPLRGIQEVPHVAIAIQNQIRPWRKVL